MPTPTPELSAVEKKVLKKVIKKPRTAAEIGAALGYNGSARALNRPLGRLVRFGLIEKSKKRPSTYTAV